MRRGFGLSGILVLALLGPGGTMAAQDHREALRIPLRFTIAPAAYSGPPGPIGLLRNGRARPLSLTSADFDEDGVPDLVAGYAAGGAGILVLRRGNASTIYPRSVFAREGETTGALDTPFLARARVFPLPDPPEFIAAGDFDGDDHPDLVAAAVGGSVLFLPGDGDGSFGSARRLDLTGGVTALLAGEFGRRDGLPDLAVAVDGADGPRLLILGSPEGALAARPEIFDLPARATALAAGDLDGDSLPDLAAAAGPTLWIMNDMERRAPREDRGAAAAPATDGARVPLPFTIASVAIGDFGGDGRTALALLSEDGDLYEMPGPADNGSSDPPADAALRSIGRFASSGSLLARAGMSGGPGDDIVVLDPRAHAMHIVQPGPRRRQADDPAQETDVTGDREPAQLALDLPGPPVAVLPMPLNGDALSDLVLLTEGRTSPTIALTVAAATFGVTNTNDSGAGSLRQAIMSANSTIGADLISFNIAGTAPYVIRPVTPLPAITDSVTVDATTQPGFAGAPIVVLDGSLAGAGASGLVLSAGSSRVRGLAIGGFGGGTPGDGIRLQGSGSHIIDGNYIGIDTTGNAAAPNAGAGVVADGTAGNTIGGTVPAARNVLSGNAGAGVVLRGAGATRNLVQGNFIGTDAPGTSPLGNAGPGVLVDGGPGNTVGGSTIATNLISGNGGAGVQISGGTATGNLVQTNLIGTDVNGTSPLGNVLDGVRIDAGGNTLGGTSLGLRNTIAFNTRNGVAVLGGAGNRLVRNPTFSNGGLGIDLAGDGVTANDTGDGDTGPNGLQNYPVVTRVVTSTTSSTIQGTFNSTPSTSFTIDFFASLECDSSGNGEGRQFLTSTVLTTDGSGNAVLNLSLPFPLPVNDQLTATATDPNGNTSEYSRCAVVSDQTPAEIAGQVFTNSTTLTWSSASDATSYNLYRGAGPYLPNLLNSAMDSCLRLNTTGTTSGSVLTEVPSAGAFYWYLVVGVNGFGQGTAGDATAGHRVLDSFGNCPTCAHEKCQTGSALASGCDPCVTSICATTPSCCSSQWTSACVGLVLTKCGSLVCPSSTGACTHPECVTGGRLVSGCDSPPVTPSCVAAVCSADTACCSIIWDSTCVDEVASVCGKTCN